MSYLFKGMEGLDTINQDLIYAVARKSISIETNFDIVLPLKRTKPIQKKSIEDAVIINQAREEI